MQKISISYLWYIVSKVILSSGSFLANIAFSIMVVLVTSGAILRYGFGWTPGWIDSACAFLVLFIVIMSAGATLAEHRHIRIKFFYDRLTPVVRIWLDLICGVLTLAFVGFLISTTYDLATMSRELGATTPDGLLLFPMQITVPLGLFILFIATASFVFQAIVKLFKRKSVDCS